jgi:di/tricarboxylate transporter
MFMLEVIIVLLVIAFMLISLYRDLMQPALVFLMAILVFFFTGIITIEEILSGVSNESILLIFLLIIVSEIIKKTTVLNIAIDKLLRPGLSYKAFIARLSAMVSFTSGWINNTPLVAFMMPYVLEWSSKKGISASKVLIPLSYAALMGGTITLIGTSTNLIVNGLSMEAGNPSLYLFNFAWVGIPASVIGMLYLVFWGSKLLPDRKNILDEFSEQTREYLVETIIPPMSKLTGKTIEQANLRNLRDLFLVQILRDDMIIAPVSPTEVIQKNDHLYFAGDTKKILNLVEGTKNLVLPFGSKMINQNKNNIIEVVIPNNSKLRNQTAKSFDFRKKYDAAIIAIQRNGEKLSGPLGEIPFKVGDMLLLVTGNNFTAENDQDLNVITKVKQIDRMPNWKIYWFFIFLAGAFALSVAKMLSLFVGLLVVIAYTSVVKMVKLDEVKRSIDFNLFFTLVLALAVGKAITNSGLASLFGDTLIGFFKSSPLYSLIALYILTNIISMFVTNAAAVAITFPVAMAVAGELGISDIRPFILVIAYAASAEFMTPFGYQTNLMVYGPGGYKFKDYVKVGFPISVIYLIVTIGILSFVFDIRP